MVVAEVDQPVKPRRGFRGLSCIHGAPSSGSMAGRRGSGRAIAARCGRALEHHGAGDGRRDRPAADRVGRSIRRARRSQAARLARSSGSYSSPAGTSSARPFWPGDSRGTDSRGRTESVSHTCAGTACTPTRLRGGSWRSERWPCRIRRTGTCGLHPWLRIGIWENRTAPRFPSRRTASTTDMQSPAEPSEAGEMAAVDCKAGRTYGAFRALRTPPDRRSADTPRGPP